MEITAEKLNEAFDKSTLTFHDRAAALATFKQDRDIVANPEDGQLYAKYDAEVLPLDECFLRFGLHNRQLIDGRSAPRTVTKDQMTTREKISYITTHGADAFEKLATKPVETNEVKTRQDFMKLPLSEKTRRYKENPNAFVELPNAVSDQPHKGYVNHKALDKIKAIRPRSKKR
ncbi:hypothetical protein [Edaphobacter sp. DSM 109919]|uniref:Uncharacterized protein n=1 Tax=Edaphobacter paludis TaxID=3035702 RepID=A0AAU7CY27_9BACT